MASSIIVSKGDNRNSGISLPKVVMARIDAVKHPDIPRSRFVSRILEAALVQLEENRRTEIVGPSCKDTHNPGCENINGREYYTAK